MKLSKIFIFFSGKSGWAVITSYDASQYVIKCYKRFRNVVTKISSFFPVK